MTKSRKLFVGFLLACFVLSTVLGFGLMASSPRTAFAAEVSEYDHFFGDQLETDAQMSMYNAMEAMYVNGIFVTGEDYDLVENGHVTQQQLEGYAAGDMSLWEAFGAARDAFYTDYDDIFYVDFSYLSLRVTQDSDGMYHAYMGSGRSDTYWLQGFDSSASINAAIREYQAARDKIVNLAKAAKPTDDQIDALGENLAAQVAQIREAHKQIALACEYRLESTCDEGNEGHVRTPYGAFVKGQVLCEGYSRAFKAIMDELGFPCVLINGGYRHTETQIEEHMWCYVKLVDGEWYAVDQTFDDRIGSVTEYASTQIKASYNEDYFLKGATFMNMHHIPSEYKSAVEYPFTYPELSEQNLGADVTVAYGNFYIEQEPFTNDMTSTNIKVSVWIEGVGWCGYDKAAENGYYIVMRHEGNYLPDKLNNHQDLSHVTDEDDDIVNTYLVWGYVNPVPEFFPNISDFSNPDGSTYTLIQNESKSTGFEFAVTTIPPRPYDWDNRWEYTADQAAEMFTYTGDISVLVARSGFIATKYNADADYQPAPSILRSTPTIQTMIKVGTTYNITIEYDQVLELMDGATEIVASVYGVRADGEILKGTNTVPISVMSDLWWEPGKLNDDGVGLAETGKIHFKFTPSKYFAHDNIIYMFNFNLQGVSSQKRVNTVEYAVANKTSYCSLGVYGYNWNKFGQPKLLENEDLSRTGWVDSDGNDVSQSKDRLALVVTSPSSKQEKAMNDMLSDELGLNHSENGELDENAFESFTYNIQLTVCKAVVIKTGEGLRLSIGFPEGFTYQSWMEGVTFKIYHFMHDAQDNITGVEEIPVTVTEYGLIILVKSFSPFALVVTKNGETEMRTDKTVIISNTPGGTAYADVDGQKSNMFTVDENDSQTVTVKANAGYVIESIKLNGSIIETNFEGEKTITLEYGALVMQNFVEASFVAQSVKAAEQERGEGAVVQQVKKAEIVLAQSSVSLNSGEKLEIKATVKVFSTSNVYQWYKDGKALPGQNSDTLVIENATASDSGSYILSVTSSNGGATTVAMSDAVVVTVAGSDTQDPDNPAVDPTEPGEGLTQTEKIIGVAVAVAIAVLVLIIAILVLKKKNPKESKKSKKSKK